ncbi:MAG TPA: hypothetical protein VFT53_00870 [Candidatus Saccharimonadales bacterium]|nr:hypothetical protein [Candidatus Saccharimonadales bacterium]
MPYHSMRPLTPSRYSLRTRLILIVALMLSVALVAMAALYYSNHLSLWRRHIPAQQPTGSPLTKGEPSPSPSSSDTKSGNQTKTNTGTTNQTNTSTGSNNSSSTAPPITGSLTAPWGTFANVYNAKTTDQMQSTCNTTPGATCQIIFTNGSVAKSLEAEMTDAGGAVYWAWTPQGVGLTSGTWHITAKAVLGTQTKTTSNDPLTLEIQ